MFNKIKIFFTNLFNKKEYSLFFKVGYLLIGSLFFPIFIASLLFIVNLTVSIYEFFIGIILLFASYFYFFYDKKNKREFYISIIIAGLLFLISIGTTYLIYDNTGDGFAYHLPAVIKLSHGWNPLYEHFDSEAVISIWSEHYPKAIWIFGAFLYQITNHIFAPQAFNFIIAFGTCFILFDIIYRITKLHILSFLSSMIISFNIILLGQLYTMYNDGVLGICVISSILIYIALFRKIYSINKIFNPINILLVSYLSVLANIKFTGALFAFVIFVVYTILLFVKKRLRLNKILLGYVVIIGLGVAIVSVNTYLPNLIHHGSIGYPLIGKDKINIIDGFVPEYINEKGKIVPFVKSITIDTSSKVYKYNLPFIINKEDFVCISGADCRQQGFGPLYQMIVMMMGIIFIVVLFNVIISKGKLKKKIFTIIDKYQIEFVSLLVLFMFFVITPATWWSRYIPYVYPVPLLMLLLSNVDYKKLNVISYLSISIVVLYTIMLVEGFNITTEYKLNYTKVFKSELSIIEDNPDKDLIYINQDNLKIRVLEEMLDRKIIEYNESKCPVENKLIITSVGMLDCGKEEK